MTLWKLAASYFIPTLIFVALLSGHFFSQLGLLERWFLHETEIRQIVTLPPAPSAPPADNRERVEAAAGQWSGNGANRNPAPEKEFDRGADDREQIPFANAYEDSIKTASRTARAYFNQALAYKRLGRLDEAIGSYRRALAYNRDFPHALLNLGTLHYRRKEWQKAREAFAAAALLDTSYAKAHFNLALTYGKLGEVDKAIQAARRAQVLDDKNAATYNLLGLMHTLQGDYESAVSVYKQGLAVNARDTELISNLSLAYLRMNKTSQAEEKL
jgi:tetratricopeptide (TPR) repeat protein